MKFNDVEINQILKKAVAESVNSSLPKVFTEAYVAEPKQFKQVTEYVSQKTKDSHVELYKGYISSLNSVSAKLDTANRTETNPRHADYKSLKVDETYNLNAVWLHELYFANCFDPNSQITMDSQSYLKLQRDFGNFDDWQKDFMASAMSAGNGWAICGYNIFLKRYVNTFIGHHSSDVMLGLFPVIVVDMWEHAYYRDYLIDSKSYLIAQMRELNWNTIEERIKKVEGIAQVIK